MQNDDDYIIASNLTRLIAQRHSSTKFERLMLRFLLVATKIRKQHKDNVDSAALNKAYGYYLWAPMQYYTQNKDELKRSKIAQDLLDDDIELNEVFELKKPADAQVIDTFFWRHNDDVLNGVIFDKTFEIAKKFEIKVSFTTEKNEEASAYYVPRIKLITMLFNDHSKEYKAETLLHELIHSVSVEAIYYIERRKDRPKTKNTTLLSKPQIKPLGEIEMFHSALITLIKKDEHYGLKNAREFLAELVAPNFRQLLQNMGLLEPILKKYFAFLESVSGENLEENLG